jgi:hypothetical protein
VLDNTPGILGKIISSRTSSKIFLVCPLGEGVSLLGDRQCILPPVLNTRVDDGIWSPIVNLRHSWEESPYIFEDESQVKRILSSLGTKKASHIGVWLPLQCSG